MCTSLFECSSILQNKWLDKYFNSSVFIFFLLLYHSMQLAEFSPYAFALKSSGSISSFSTKFPKNSQLALHLVPSSIEIRHYTSEHCRYVPRRRYDAADQRTSNSVSSPAIDLYSCANRRLTWTEENTISNCDK